jgi:hypothetical protein
MGARVACTSLSMIRSRCPRGGIVPTMTKGLYLK